MHLHIKLAIILFSPSHRLIVPTKRVKKISGTRIIARFGDNSNSTKVGRV